MKHQLLIAFAAALVLAASPVRADAFRQAGFFGPSDPCEVSCRANADQCREQCSHPDEPEQCIVNCSRSDCNASCNEFEKACDRHCEAAKKG